MTGRPGAALLGTLVRGELRGNPGAAREAALAAARRAERDEGPDAAAAHRLDAVYASLQVGEPRRALALLDETKLPAGDDGLRRRAKACRAWAAKLDVNWYPGDSGAELAPGAVEPLEGPGEVGPGDGETRMVEGCVVYGPPALYPLRSLLGSLVVTAPQAAVELVGQGFAQLESFRLIAEEASCFGSAAWAVAMQADLAYRGGRGDVAQAHLDGIRGYHQEVGDPVGAAVTWLLEGDWWATPGSFPETLGYHLEPRSSDSPLLALRDDARALSCYQRAASLLAGVDAPLAAGALALRRATLAWRAGDAAAHSGWLDQAREAYAAAGDAAHLHLVTVHRLLADIARGEVARTRLESGASWDLGPRGAVADILAWAEERGSVAFCTGLGRLLMRAGAAWQQEGDPDRAATAYSVSIPLLGASGAVTPVEPLVALAILDDQRDWPARALVRLEQATSLLRLPPRVAGFEVHFLKLVDLVATIINAQINRVGSSALAAGVGGLRRALDLLDALAAVPGLPTADVAESLLRDSAGMLEETRRAHLDTRLADLPAALGGARVDRMTEIAAQALREQQALVRSQVLLNNGRLAQRGGWQAEAERWFDAALEAIDDDGRQPWLAVLVHAVRGDEEAARERFREVLDAGLLPAHMLAPLALRAGEPEIARSLFARLDGGAPRSALTWTELADRAEAALDCGDHRDALNLAGEAIERFEAIVAGMTRDPDRIAVCDDLSAAFLYLTATRAALGVADLRRAAGDEAGRRAALVHAFDLSDRGRTLSLSPLIDPADLGAPVERRWHQAATVWAAAFDRLLHAYEAAGGAGAEAHAAELARAEEELLTLEAEHEGARLATPEGGLRPPGVTPPAGRNHGVPATSSAVADRLPPGACILEYHLVGRHLVLLALMADGIVEHRRRWPRPEMEALVHRFLAATSAGEAGEEAEELAAALLQPVASVLEGHSRVLVVPFGALHAVPFHALPFSGRPLVESHVVSYLPAASLLSGQRVDATLDGGGAVVVGDPAFEPAAHPGLRRLPGASVEARAVGRLHDGADVLVDEEADDNRLRPLLAGGGVIHLAAHGRLDAVAPSTSSVVLAGRDELTVADLIGMRLNADLVVLSACDTGRGSASLGGELVGLGRGLLAAGVRRSVVSLWPVDDVVSCVTMVEFHRQLADGAPPALALATAQRLLRAMSVADLEARFNELGGAVEPGAPSLRRGVRSATRAAPRLIPLDPDFVDVEPPEDEEAAEPSEGATRDWAPFVLVGA